VSYVSPCTVYSDKTSSAEVSDNTWSVHCKVCRYTQLSSSASDEQIHFKIIEGAPYSFSLLLKILLDSPAISISIVGNSDVCGKWYGSVDCLLSRRVGGGGGRGSVANAPHVSTLPGSGGERGKGLHSLPMMQTGAWVKG
jgi:hypothetical protein